MKTWLILLGRGSGRINTCRATSWYHPVCFINGKGTDARSITVLENWREPKRVKG